MINSPVLKKIMFPNIKYFHKENGRKLTPFWDTELYVVKDKNLHFRRFFKPSDTTWSLLTAKYSYLISNATWTLAYFLLITIILNDYGRAVWRKGPNSIIVPQDGNISSCNTVPMFSSPSITLFLVKLSVGWYINN